MATNSITLARKILSTEKPGGLQSMGSQRVQHDTQVNPALLTFLCHFVTTRAGISKLQSMGSYFYKVH